MAHILPDNGLYAWCGHGTPLGHTCQFCAHPPTMPDSPGPLPRPKRDAPSGWTCPSCGHSYAPWVPECHHCPVAAPEAGALAYGTLRLPPEMARPGFTWMFRAGGEWADAWPGLQILLGQPVSDGEEAIVHLRLTPAGTVP